MKGWSPKTYENRFLGISKKFVWVVGVLKCPYFGQIWTDFDKVDPKWKGRCPSKW